MNDETIQFEVGSGNVYADLGFPDAEDMLVKAQLAMKCVFHPNVDTDSTGNWTPIPRVPRPGAARRPPGKRAKPPSPDSIPPRKYGG